MVPTDGRFLPYPDSPLNEPNGKSERRTNGRIFVLSFQSSTQRHMFWLQSKSQHPKGEPSYFSPLDLKRGEIVNRLLQGDEFNVQEELDSVPKDEGDKDGSHDDVVMEDADPEGHGEASASGGGDSSEQRGLSGGHG